MKEVGVELLGLETQGILGLDLHSSELFRARLSIKLRLCSYGFSILATTLQLFIPDVCDHFVDFMMPYNVGTTCRPKLGTVNWPMCSYFSLGSFLFRFFFLFLPVFVFVKFIHIMLSTDAGLSNCVEGNKWRRSQHLSFFSFFFSFFFLFS